MTNDQVGNFNNHALAAEEAVAKLKELRQSDDPEIAHQKADDILCTLLGKIGFKDVVAEFEAITKWYA